MEILFQIRDLNISIDSDDSTFKGLQEVYYEYWEEAQVLDNGTLVKYKSLVYDFLKIHEYIEKQVINGRVSPPNDINISKNKKEKSKEYEIEEFKLLPGQEYIDLDLVFNQKNGKTIHPTEMHRNYRKIVEISVLHYKRFHDLIHTNATLMLQQVFHPNVVSELCTFNNWYYHGYPY
jgi:hypothetical protein